jgi:hypothetical protein
MSLQEINSGFYAMLEVLLDCNNGNGVFCVVLAET